MAKNKKDSDENKPKNNKIIFIVLFILGLLVIGGAAFGAVYIFMEKNKAISSQPVIEEYVYTDLEEFTINLADEKDKRYFKASLSIGYNKDDEKIAEEIKSKPSVIRDVIIFYFKGKKAEFVNDVTNEAQMKKELVENINKELNKGKISDVRFKNMIIQ